MSRYNHYGDRRDGYDAYEHRREWESYPYEQCQSYGYRQGWEAAERDERWDRDRREEDRMAEEHAQHAALQRSEEPAPEQYFEPQYPDQEQEEVQP